MFSIMNEVKRNLSNNLQPDHQMPGEQSQNDKITITFESSNLDAGTQHTRIKELMVEQVVPAPQGWNLADGDYINETISNMNNAFKIREERRRFQRIIFVIALVPAALTVFLLLQYFSKL